MCFRSIMWAMSSRHACCEPVPSISICALPRMPDLPGLLPSNWANSVQLPRFPVPVKSSCPNSSGARSGSFTPAALRIWPSDASPSVTSTPEISPGASCSARSMVQVRSCCMVLPFEMTPKEKAARVRRPGAALQSSLWRSRPVISRAFELCRVYVRVSRAPLIREPFHVRSDVKVGTVTRHGKNELHPTRDREDARLIDPVGCRQTRPQQRCPLRICGYSGGRAD